MSKKIKIRIECTECISFNQTVEMTRAEWTKLKRTPEDRLEDSDMSPLASVLDLHDPLGSQGFSNVEMEVVDGDGNPVEPADYYGQGVFPKGKVKR
jgi:hypothetical protein